jgi:hypothetical protein
VCLEKYIFLYKYNQIIIDLNVGDHFSFEQNFQIISPTTVKVYNGCGEVVYLLIYGENTSHKVDFNSTKRYY